MARIGSSLTEVQLRGAASGTVDGAADAASSRSRLAGDNSGAAGGSMLTAESRDRGLESPREAEPARPTRAVRRLSLQALSALGEGCQPAERLESGTGSLIPAAAERADLRRAAEFPPAPLDGERVASESDLRPPLKSPCRPVLTCPSTCPCDCLSAYPSRGRAGRAALWSGAASPDPDHRSPLCPRPEEGSRRSQERRRHALFVNRGLLLQEARLRESHGAGLLDLSWRSRDRAE